MDIGIDGTGRGAALHRAHPLSHLKDNTGRDFDDVGRMFQAMTQGINVKNGTTMYYRGGKVPNPSIHPYLTGEPCPVYGWRITDHKVIRHFDVPLMDREKMKLKPYVALQDAALMEKAKSRRQQLDSEVAQQGVVGGATAPENKDVDKKDSKKQADDRPLLKRLFFWK